MPQNVLNSHLLCHSPQRPLGSRALPAPCLLPIANSSSPSKATAESTSLLKSHPNHPLPLALANCFALPWGPPNPVPDMASSCFLQKSPWGPYHLCHHTQQPTATGTSASFSQGPLTYGSPFYQQGEPCPQAPHPAETLSPRTPRPEDTPMLTFLVPQAIQDTPPTHLSRALAAAAPRGPLQGLPQAWASPAPALASSAGEGKRERGHLSAHTTPTLGREEKKRGQGSTRCPTVQAQASVPWLRRVAHVNEPSRAT